MSEPTLPEESIFAQAREIRSPTERAAYLDRVCGDDVALRAEVEALLQADAQTGDLLDVPDVPSTPVEESVPLAGTTIAGRYKLLELIGEGGMGAVWMAEQTEPVKRRVALKLIKSGMNSQHVLARFQAERQALALMDHPNIAKVFDGGTTANDRPYFVMELVKGAPITRYCDDNRLTVSERLGLFVPVCAAVQHAHQKGVIHRDIKPSNVLVAPYDGRPVPKVIDFGVAKAIGQPLTEKTLFTGLGALVGTPEYMSPEQAELNNLDIDTRSDVYALGVLLYELLTGSTPLTRQRAHEAALLEVLRLVREEEPPRPSTRLSSTEELPSIAASRGCEPKKLSGIVRGELDWIVLKALEKDRGRRYDSANALALDLQRYLADEPVQAGPPSARYRFRKFARRHRGKLAVLVAILALTLIGAGVSTWQAVRATRALQQVTTEQTKTQAALRSAREALDTLTDNVVETMFAKHPELGESEKAFLRKILEEYEEVTRQLGETPEARVLRAKGAFQVALLHGLIGDKPAAVVGYRRAVELLGQLANDFPDQPEYRHKLARTYGNLGELLGDLKQPTEAETVFRQGLALRQRLANDFPNVRAYRRELAANFSDLATLQLQQKRYPEGEAGYRQALGLLERLVAEDGADPLSRQSLARVRSDLGMLLREQGKHEAADALYQQALSAQKQLLGEFPDVPKCRRELADSYHGLGILRAEQKKFSEAEMAFHQALDLRQHLVDKFPNATQYRHDLARGYGDLGRALLLQSKTADAEPVLRRAQSEWEKLIARTGPLPENVEFLAQTDNTLGNLLFGTSHWQESKEVWRKAVALRQQLAKDFPSAAVNRIELAGTLLNLANVHHRARKFAAAVLLLAEARPHVQAALQGGQASPGWRKLNRDILVAQAQNYRALADHAHLATVADELARFRFDPLNDTYFAACILGRCAVLVGQDTHLDKARRQEVARGYTDRAMTVLRRAIELGFQNTVRLRHDPDLAPLREREEFLELLANLEGKPAE